MPCFEQLFGHVFSEQSMPLNPSAHLHVPSTQKPFSHGFKHSLFSQLFPFFRALILFPKRIRHFRPREGHARFLTTEHRKYKFHLCNCPSRCNRRSRRESRTLDLSRSARRFSGDICMRLRRIRLDYCNF